ncbi:MULTISPECIES: HutD family protein [unclassified Sedimentibacter]|uniref:HutD family protein n=1 Tax=unclassified Sedimentibacter TaxID=2649220 RepID=UPI0027DF461B|nr:HutD family protein [Sedimentibacter sp. MB35-C1]WMJ76875.1 HutD family protein [Sedimentibacter sp. MB35-C1]
MKEKIIKKENFVTTKWAGGETTQLAIYPYDSVFSNKDFLWRISSATFTSTESTFSDFTGYQRYILPLNGELSLKHSRLYDRSLRKYDVEYFDGSWNTFSKNTLDCRDYNFIVKSGFLSKMQILNEKEEYLLKKSEVVTFFSVNEFTLELPEHGGKRKVDGFSLYIIETDNEDKVKILNAKLPVIITEFATGK